MLQGYISLTKSHDAPPLSAPASPSTAPSVAKKRKTAPSKLKNEQDSRASSVDPVKREKSTEPVNLSMKAPFGLASSPVNVPLIKLGESSTPASSPPAKIKLKLKF